jgi:hypothetical protein
LVEAAPRDHSPWGPADKALRPIEDAIRAFGIEVERDTLAAYDATEDGREVRWSQDPLALARMIASYAKPREAGTESLVISEDMVEAGVRIVYPAFDRLLPETQFFSRQKFRSALEAAITTSRGSTK